MQKKVIYMKRRGKERERQKNRIMLDLEKKETMNERNVLGKYYNDWWKENERIKKRKCNNKRKQRNKNPWKKEK